MAATTPEADVVKAQMKEPKQVKLKKSGITVDYDADPSVEDIRAAQKASSKDRSLFSLYLAQRVCLFDGKKKTMGEIQSLIRGLDYLQLTGALLGGDDEDEDGEGNL